MLPLRVKETPSYIFFLPGLWLGSITIVSTKYLGKIVNSHIYTCMITRVVLTETCVKLNPYVIKNNLNLFEHIHT